MHWVLGCPKVWKIGEVELKSSSEAKRGLFLRDEGLCVEKLENYVILSVVICLSV